MGRRKGSLNKKTLAKMGLLKLPDVIDPRTDKEILDDIIERFNLFRTLIMEAANESGRSIAVSGAPGVGKSFELERQIALSKIPATIVSGTISSVELYALAYEHRNIGDIVVLDDADSIMGDEEGVNILKVMMDSGKKRTLSWRKQNMGLQERGIEPYFEYKGAVIAISNVDWQTTILTGKSKYSDHLRAIMDRCLYLNLRIHDRRSIRLWIEYVARRDMFKAKGVTEKQGEDFLDWMEEHQDALAQYSLRTLDKLCEMKEKRDWKRRASLTLFR